MSLFSLSQLWTYFLNLGLDATEHCVHCMWCHQHTSSAHNSTKSSTRGGHNLINSVLLEATDTFITDRVKLDVVVSLVDLERPSTQLNILSKLSD